jgi:hypothetical protein
MTFSERLNLGGWFLCCFLMDDRRLRALWKVALSVALLFGCALSSFAEPYSAALGSTETLPPLPRPVGVARLDNLSISPLRLQGGSTFTMISPERWEVLARRISRVIEKVHREYNVLLGRVPPFVASVRLLERDAFLLKTGAPTWTNALYYRGEIMIPFSELERLDAGDLTRSVRHEYLHAVVHALSGGKCPGWIDEGLAQWAEGAENPALRAALVDWLIEHEPVALELLQGGFTRLQTAMVPAAYAESLYSANMLVERFGFAAIRRYFDLLKTGAARQDAFLESFHVSEATFEQALGTSLKSWSKRQQLAAR